MRHSELTRFLSLIAVAAGVFLSGCATNSPIQPIAAIKGMSGAVHGGQQPISGATIQLYTVSTSDVDPSSTPLLTAPVASDSSGNFSITGLYTCPSAGSLVYLVATGGSPGSGITNAQIALMAAIGTCGSLTSSTFININELTTVAAVYALAPYMASYSAISSGSDTTPLASAFTYAGYIANTTTGTTPGLNVPAGSSVPIAQVNTIADLLAACINSPGGVSGDTSICGQFFALTLPDPNFSISTDTIGALLWIAQIPTTNTAALFNLIPASSPFQPTDTIVPPDFAVRLLSNSPFTVAPSSLAFASAVVSATQSSQTLTVTNGTAAAVNITSAAITGVNTSDFAIASTTCGSAVPANSSCIYQISFVPTTTGARAAYFVLANDSPNSSIAVALSGSGTPGVVTLTPTSATFPPTNAGSVSSIYFTLSNSSNTIVGITAFSISNPAFTLTNQCSGQVVPATGSCTILVEFFPTGPGPQSGTLSIQLWGGTTLSSDFSAVATGPDLQFSSGSLTFPATPVGTAAQPQTVTLYNYGTGPTAYLFRVINGTGASSFSETNDCPTALAVNAFCTFTVTANPTQTGAIAASLVAYAVGSTATLPTSVTGTTATPPVLHFSSTSLTFPSTPIGIAAPQQTVTLYNSGTGPAQNIAAVFSGAGASSFSETNDCPAALAANASCTFTVTAAPTQTGAIVANLVVSVPASSATLTATVTGTPGTPTNNPLVPSDSQIYVPSGGSSVITLTNTGTGSITFASINATAGFSQTNTCGATLAAGATCNVQLTAAVATQTPVIGTLTVSSNAQTLVQTVTLYSAANVANFGPVVVGYPASSPFATYCGIYGCNVTTAGPDPGDFPPAGSSPGCYPRSQTGCYVYTQFVPTAVGQRIAISNSSNSYPTLLVGTGVPATGQVTSFSISAGSINFGTYYIGYTSPQPVTLTLTNTGNQPVPINSITTTSSFFLGYQFPETNTCGSSLAVGSTCTITVSFSNTNGGGGNATGQLTILSYSLTPTINIPLYADPIYPQPNFSFSSTSVTLAPTQAGTSSTAQTITFSNNGNSPVTVATGPYTSGNTVFTYATNCGAVAIGGTCTITVNGTPPSVGTFSDVLPVAVTGPPTLPPITQNITVSVTGN